MLTRRVVAVVVGLAAALALATPAQAAQPTHRLILMGHCAVC